MTASASHERPDVIEALARSVLWQAVSLGLAPPDTPTCERFTSPSALAHLAAAAAQVAPGLEDRIAALAAAGGPTRHAHDTLFGHTSRGEVPPYETEWGKDDLFRKPQELADLMGFLQAFGLRIDPAAHERVDHAACEAELMAFLAAREARALEDGDGAACETVRRAERLLLRDHLGRFGPAFARALVGADAGFHGRLGELLHALLQAECRRFRVAAGADILSPRPTDVDEQPVECGPGDELIQIQKATLRGER